jgi:hypothetical protein
MDMSGRMTTHNRSMPWTRVSKQQEPIKGKVNQLTDGISLTKIRGLLNPHHLYRALQPPKSNVEIEDPHPRS